MSLLKPQAVICYALKYDAQVLTQTRGFRGYGIPIRPDCTQRDKDGFRILRIPGLHKVDDGRKKYERRFERSPRVPRAKRMPVNQDWTNVWPTASVFKPSVVPLPIRQGRIKNASENFGIVPDKFQNLELMKIQNFLHLTPPHIKKHTAALKKYCTPWPKGLENAEAMEEHFPITITTRDYVMAMPTIRDPRSRKVTMKIKSERLDLDEHAKDKLMRLLGDRHDKQTDVITLEADSCPIKQQNTDHVKYQLTALYYESWKVEEWESEKTWADNADYIWEQSVLKPKAESLVSKIPGVDETEAKKNIQEYGEAVTKLHNKGENSETLSQYKSAVLKLLNFEQKAES